MIGKARRREGEQGAQFNRLVFMYVRLTFLPQLIRYLKRILIQKQIIQIPDSRFNFLLTVRKQSFDDYLTELRKLRRDCELEDKTSKN